MKLILYLSAFLACRVSFGQPGVDQYWDISEGGGIVWKLADESRLPHTDNIEMAGRKVAAIIHYTVNRHRQLEISRDIIYPQLRTYDRTNGVSWQRFRAYRRLTYGADIEPNITYGTERLVFDKLDSARIDGALIFYHAAVRGIVLTRTLVPSMTERLFVERWTLTNSENADKHLTIGHTKAYTDIAGYKGNYQNHVYDDAPDSMRLRPGQSYTFGIYFAAAINDEPVTGFNAQASIQGREEFLEDMRENLVLTTNDPVIDKLFYFSKIRAAESIFDSKHGLIHSPGGGNYYVGVWANDQAEYSGPFFPLLGYAPGIQAAENAYELFRKHIPVDDKPIPYSFEIEGEVLASNKDRGDAAMIAYGTSLYLLRSGNKERARKLWPLITWSLAYCNRKLNAEGVVTSQTDEMEGRIATGSANLATSALYYGGLKHASGLARELGYTELSKTYLRRAAELERNLDKYFGYELEGLHTYRYYHGNEHLRHWIALPLVMGINRRAEGTAAALLDKMWTPNGVLVELNPDSKVNQVFWDRATLYVLRGTFKAGFIDESITKFHAFSQNRLLGAHVPYVIEAYPENNMRHLSAESALYCMVVIEGMLGLEQNGFNKITINPRLNDQLSLLKLEKLHIGNHTISIDAALDGDNVSTKIYVDGKRVVDTKRKVGSKIEIMLSR